MALSPTIAFAMRSIRVEPPGCGSAVAASPCRRALRLALVLPRDVRGPVLLRELSYWP
jgi:hypothetical protein